MRAALFCSFSVRKDRLLVGELVASCQFFHGFFTHAESLHRKGYPVYREGGLEGIGCGLNCVWSSPSVYTPLPLFFKH